MIIGANDEGTAEKMAETRNNWSIWRVANGTVGKTVNSLETELQYVGERVAQGHFFL